MSGDERYQEVVDELVADPDVEDGKMFGMRAAKLRGKAFASLFDGELVVKLGAERVHELVESGLATRFDPMGGRPMKEWAQVSDGHPDWLQLVEEAKAFVASGAGR